MGTHQLIGRYQMPLELEGGGSGNEYNVVITRCGACRAYCLKLNREG